MTDLRPILTTSNEIHLSFGNGRFDEWCIYVDRRNDPNAPKDERYFFPLDSWYFEEVARIDKEQPGVYEDFLKIYDATTKEITEEALDLCKELPKKYNEAELVELIFSILYAGMIAEENKKNTKLGKRIKRLGMHQTLVENVDPYVAAHYSRGLKWQEIDEECKQRGF